MSQNKRRIKDCWRTEVVRKDQGVEITFRGSNTSNTVTEQTVELKWFQFRQLVRDAKKAWDADRVERVAEIARNDAVFPKEGA
jgi:hypothetical protein